MSMGQGPKPFTTPDACPVCGWPESQHKWPCERISSRKQTDQLFIQKQGAEIGSLRGELRRSRQHSERFMWIADRANKREDAKGYTIQRLYGRLVIVTAYAVGVSVFAYFK